MLARQSGRGFRTGPRGVSTAGTSQVMDYLANGIPERPARFIKHYKIIITRRNLRRNNSRGRNAQLKPAPRFTMRKEDDRGV